MRILKTILRFYSYLFHTLLCLFLLAISALAAVSGLHNLHLPMLPWTGRGLTYWLLGSSLLGLLAVGLAVTGRLRILFSVWALAVFVMIVRGYFLSGVTFSGFDHFSRILLFVFGALLAAWGGLTRPARRG